MQDLQEVTQEIHYENFRSEKLAGGTPARKIARWVVLQVFLWQGPESEIYIENVFSLVHVWELYIATCQAHPALVKRVQCMVRYFLILGSYGPKDPWLHVLSMPGAKVVRLRPHPTGTWQYTFLIIDSPDTSPFTFSKDLKFQDWTFQIPTEWKTCPCWWIQKWKFITSCAFAQGSQTLAAFQENNN